MKGPRIAELALAMSALIMLTPVVYFSLNGADLAPAATAAFTFGTAGDYAFDSDTFAVWDSMKANGIGFALTLGDHSYGATSEANWCSNFKARVPNVLITAGNHDTGESSGDQIADLVAACPYPFASGLNGNYGREYWFNYPLSSPVARIIVTGCGTTFTLDGTGRWACSVGDGHYNFVRNAIDGARSADIRWTIVAMHKLCISMSDKTCETGQDFMDLLHFKKVDLVLQAHSHSYQRSKSLACAVRTLYVSECVRNPGNATVTAVVGTGGQTGDAINTGDSENGYFAAWSGTNTAGWGHGWLKVAVSADGITGTFVNARSTFTDTFSLAAGATGEPPPPPPPPPPQCSDTLDNDGDGLVDFPADPGCSSTTDDDETNVPPPPPNGTGFFVGQYYDNVDLTNLKLTRTDAAINFLWGSGSPDPSIAPDTFSARWNGNFSFATTGNYRFSVQTDDGMRIWIDGILRLDQWRAQNSQYSFTVALSTGVHWVRVEYFESGGGAKAVVSWALA